MTPIRQRGIFESMKDLPPPSLGRALRQSDMEDAITSAVTEKEERSRSKRAPFDAAIDRHARNGALDGLAEAALRDFREGKARDL